MRPGKAKIIIICPMELGRPLDKGQGSQGKNIKYYFVTSLMQTSDVLVVAVPNIKQKTYNLTPRMHTGATRTK